MKTVNVLKQNIRIYILLKLFST